MKKPLAYLFLLKACQPLSQEELEKDVEKFINDTFNIPMDFEINDDLNKLIVQNNGSNKYEAVNILKALEILA